MKGQEPIPLGWQAIAGEEFAFEMTVRCLLQPGANGVPDWSAEAFRLGVPKRSEAHHPLIPDGAQLSEQIGQCLALWAKGTLSGEPLVQQARAVAATGTAAYAEYWKTLATRNEPDVSCTRFTVRPRTAQFWNWQRWPERANGCPSATPKAVSRFLP